MNTEHFSGVFTALVTPMRDEKVAFDELEKLVDWQIKQGIQGLVAVGTTGESPTLSHEEHIDVVRCMVQVAQGRVPILAGTGSNSTDEAIMLTERSEQAGADGMLVVAPYYNKPSQQGLLLHLRAIADATRKPIMLYSIPSRCGIEIANTTVAKLHASHPHVFGIKEAGGSCDKVEELVRTMGKDFIVLSGDDALTLPFISVGARGVISVASNFAVQDLVRMVQLALDNDFDAARAIHHRYADFFKNIFIEPNPVPIKYVLQQQGIIGSANVRLPLAPLSPQSQALVEQALQGILS